jgi:hypothetical protein
VAGPVTVEWRTLVDECRDVALADSTAGDVSIATENARTVQEDCHRLAMRPGSSVVYRVDGPISRWRVFSFTRVDDPQLEIAVSADGKEYQPVAADRRGFASGQTVYGYLTPVLFEGAGGANEARHLRIGMPGALPPRAGDKSNEAPLEIGRIEIEYDRAAEQTAEDVKKPAGKPAPVNAAVFVDNPRFIRGTLAAIEKAAARGDRRLNVVVTIQADLTDDFRIKRFGWHGPAWEFVPADEAMHAHLKSALRQVFAKMVEHDMDIYILPHIDAGGRVRTWRNWVDFDPRDEFAGYSYEKLMIDSIAGALAETMGESTKVELALSGEMGTSLFRYPESYREIVRRLREESGTKRAKVGFSLNHDKIAGNENPSGVVDIQLTEEGRREMQALIDECDFVGMSFYRPVSLPPTVADFVSGIDAFMSEFARHGLSIPAHMPLHFSEVGIGGGEVRRGSEPDPMKAVAAPWEGSGFARRNPWRTDKMTQLRRQYHQALLDFLGEQPARWNVTAAFFWSMGSWDPQGMQGSAFADPQIVDAILRHNRKSSER